MNRPDGTERPVLKEQSSFGIYAYHEGTLEGWASSIQGAQRIEENLYLISVPNEGTAKVTVKVQAIDGREDPLPEDPIKPKEYPKGTGTGPGYESRKGCWYAIWKLFGGK